jgi:thiosulfate/3-mercaptopyruvate sulfurtransferase
MYWSRIIFFIPLLMVACNLEKVGSTERQSLSRYLITADELKNIIGQDSVTILDLRQPEDFELGHIPDAVNIWRTDIDNDSALYQGMMASKEIIEELFSRKGIGSGQFLILYDGRGSCEAARLWWILNYYGYNHMAILDGGIDAWKSMGPISIKEPVHKSASFRLPVNPRTETLITLSELSQLDQNNDVLLVDARTFDEYSGKIIKNGASVGGRIPGSIHLDWVNAVDQQSKRFKSLDELKAAYKPLLGNDPERRLVVYCHSGVRSAHTFFVLTELLGYKNVHNFDGSDGSS